MPEATHPAIRLNRLLFLLLAVFAGYLPMAKVRADDQAVREYYIQEPVFHARVRMLEAGRPDAPLIVLVHGLNASADVWRPFIPALSQHFRVVAFDLPGFGQSSKGNKLYSPDNYVAFMHFVIARLAVNRLMLIGHSMGGNIALRYASTYPQQVRRLVLIDAAGILHRLVYSEFLAHFGIRALPELYPDQQHDLKLLANNLFGVLTQYSPIMDIGERLMLSRPDLRKQFLGGYPPAIAAYAMSLTDFSNILDGFSVPTLLLWGGQDHVAPLRTAQLLAANFVNAGLVVFPDTGHNPLQDDTTALNAWLLRFTTADPAERDAILAQHRYRLSSTLPDTSARTGRCRYAKHQAFTGDYRLLVIDHCREVRLHDLRAQFIIIKHSQVNLENCSLQSTGKTLQISNSVITMTACRIEGAPAIEMTGSRLDIAGSHVRSSGNAIVAEPIGSTSTLLFSVSELLSGDRRRFEHGPMQLLPGQVL